MLTIIFKNRMLAHYKNRGLLHGASQLLQQYQDLKSDCQLALFLAFTFGTLLTTSYTYFTIILISPCLDGYNSLNFVVACGCAGKP